MDQAEYTLYQDQSNPTHFKTFEIWYSKDGLDRHMVNPYLAEFKSSTAGMIESLDVYLLDKII